MSGEYLDSDFYSESSYTADISNKMRVPDRLYAHNGGENGHGDDGRWKEQEQYSIHQMHVPDRILVGGGNEHIASKSTPRELQLEKTVVPPSPEHVRVNTPPRSLKLTELYFPTVYDVPFLPTPLEAKTRSIKLDEVSFPSAGDTPIQSPPPPPRQVNRAKPSQHIHFKEERSMSYDQEQSLLMTPTADNSISMYDEVQRMRTQMAKLNHRLMALELENQSQTTRWQLLSVIVSAYFIAKTFVWLNRY